MGSKIRGKKGKCQDIVNRFAVQTDSFPHFHRGQEYWHLHFPVALEFRGLKSIPSKMQRQWVQAMLNAAEHLETIKPRSEVEIRIVTLITLPDVTDSQIIVFLDEDYYQKFMARNCQPALRLTPEETPLSTEWNLAVAGGVQESGFADTKSEIERLWLFERRQ